MKYLFLDTNIFIHYKGFEDIPWKDLLSTKDDVTIVMTSIILREINGHKDSSKGKVKNRARKISEKLNAILLKGQSSRVPLIYFRETPIKEHEKEIYDLTVNDDRFLLNVLHSSYPKDDVYVVSNDTDLLLKAKEAGLNILQMDETFRSTEEPTEEEKELKKVKEELARWTDRRADPKLLFSDTRSDVLIFERLNFKPLNEIVEEQVAAEATRYPEEKDEEVTYDNYFDNFQNQLSMSSIRLNSHTPAQKAVFNQMRKEYLEAFRKKEELIVLKQMRKLAFKRLKMVLLNDGTAQTGDVHITLRFPDSAKIYTPRDSKESYSFEPPVKPQFNRAFAQLAGITNLASIGYVPDNSVEMWNPDKPASKLEYSFDISRLTHGLQVEIDKEIYINTEVVQEFEIEWFIADSSLIDHKYGKLKVVVADKK